MLKKVEEMQNVTWNGNKEWNINTNVDIPQQEEGTTDCGVFVAYWARRIVDGKNLVGFKQINIAWIRRMIVQFFVEKINE